MDGLITAYDLLIIKNDIGEGMDIQTLVLKGNVVEYGFGYKDDFKIEKEKEQEVKQ